MPPGSHRETSSVGPSVPGRVVSGYSLGSGLGFGRKMRPARPTATTTPPATASVRRRSNHTRRGEGVAGALLSICCPRWVHQASSSDLKALDGPRLVTMHGQALFLLPASHCPHAALQIGRNFFPGIETSVCWKRNGLVRFRSGANETPPASAIIRLIKDPAPGAPVWTGLEGQAKLVPGRDRG